MAVITLITDYGERDSYAGVLKGVLLSRAPEATVVDVTHEIEPFNVAHGAFVLWQIWSWYPAGTVHLAVVDPGVGSGRRILIGQYDGRYVVAPDNGLLTFVHRELTAEALHVLRDTPALSPGQPGTFHGRDIMAPVAANVANGLAPSTFGDAIDKPVLLPISPRPEVSESVVTGRVVHVDHFGTLVTNIRAKDIESLATRVEGLEVWINNSQVGPIRRTFSDVEPGQAVALFGGSGFLEVAVNQGRAVEPASWSFQRFDRNATVVVRPRRMDAINRPDSP